MIASLLAAAVAWWMKDVLPPPARLRAELYGEPRQTSVRQAALAAFLLSLIAWLFLPARLDD